MKLDSKKLKLYAVTDRTWLLNNTLAKEVEESIKGGVTIVQLREKELEFNKFLEEAIEIKKVCKKYNVPLIINDNIEIAKLCDADGVHIGQSDINLIKAREVLGIDKIIGVSAHNLEEAIYAQENGANYLGVGAVFSTTTKLDANLVTFNTLSEICKLVSIPVVAIGGINNKNIYNLKGSGICGVAVVSAIYGKGDAMASAMEINCIIDEVLYK